MTKQKIKKKIECKRERHMRKKTRTVSSDVQPIVGITILSVNIDVIIISFAKLRRRIVEIAKAFMVSEFSTQNVQVRWVGVGRLQDSKGIDFAVELFISKEAGVALLSVDEGDRTICE